MSTGRTKDNQEQKPARHPGGVSRSIDYLVACLTGKSSPDQFPREAALHDLAEVVRITYDQVKNGDTACGYFLGELLSIFGKKSCELAQQNSAFAKAVATWKPVRIASAKDSALRAYVAEIIAKALTRRGRYAILQLIPGAEDLQPDDKFLSKLPEIAATNRSVNAWMNRVVYPQLRRMKDQLDADPRIAKVKRYHDANTKIQPSRMKKDARDALMRIARMPKSYYFHSA